MIDNVKNQKKKKLRAEEKILAKNTFYSFLQRYSSFILSIVTSFLIARMITKDVWGILILALSYVAIFSLVLNFLPPNMGQTLQFYLPRYRALNQNSMLKSFLVKAIVLRVLFSLVVYIISLFVFTLFIDLFKINLKQYYYVFYLVSPLILIKQISGVFYEINRSFNMFRSVFILILINNFIYIGGLTLSFIFIEYIEINLIALMLVLSYFVPFLINCYMVFMIIKFRIRKDDGEKLSYKQILLMLFKYGIHLSVRSFISSLASEIQVQSIGIVISPEWVTGYNIGKHYDAVTLEGIGALSNPLTIAFSSYHAKEEFSQIEKIYKLIINYSLFLILLLSGILFFFVDFFLRFVYGQQYLTYSLLVKIMLTATIFNILGSFFALLRVTKKLKYIVPISLVESLTRIILFLIGLFIWGILGAMILVTVANFIVFLLLSFFLKKIISIKLNLFKLILQYLTFFISISVTIILDTFVLADLNFVTLQSLNLTYFQQFNGYSLLLFLILFFLLNFLFKIFSHTDIELIEELFEKDNLLHKLIRTGLLLMKKILTH